MNLDDIKLLITNYHDNESKQLEFKKSTASIKSAMETICAFLNSHGGIVLIGVTDNGKIVGQDVVDQTKLEISSLITRIEPPTDLGVYYIKLDNGKFVICLEALENLNLAPYVFSGQPFWRIESATRPMPQERYKQLLVERIHKNNPWECSPAKKIDLKDLDTEEIINTIEDSISRGRLESRFATKDPKDALRKLKLIENDKLINAAIVLFARDPEQYYPQCLLRVVRFKGLTKELIIDSKRIYGHAFKLLKEAEDFVMRHMSIESEFVSGSMIRKDIPDYSLRAVREAVVNGICHRDYTIHGGSLSLMMYDDRMEVSSHGVLPLGIALEDLKQPHESQPRNDRVTQVLYRRGIIESVGSGTQEMVNECLKLGKPEPEYTERANTFVVIFKNKDKEYNQVLRPELDMKLNARQREILIIMRSLGQCTTTQILEKLASSSKDNDMQKITDRTLRNDLNKLEELHYVQRQGQKKATLWFITDN